MAKLFSSKEAKKLVERHQKLWQLFQYVESRDVVHFRVGMLLDFQRIQHVSLRHQQVDFPLVFIPIKIKRRIQHALIIIALQHLRNYEALKKGTGHGTEELKDIVYADIWENIHRGSMPELYANPDFDWQMFYGAYVRTYIERDVRELTQVGDEVKFTKFMAVMAARIGQLLNLSAVASDVGISQPTADRWLSILTASNIVYLLQPYSNNLAKRAVKTPKLYRHAS